MAYERDDRRYGRDQGGHRPQHQQRDFDRAGSQYGYDRDRQRGREWHDGDAQQHGGDHGQRSSGRGYASQPQGYDYEDRGFFERAGDEVRSWFGDEEAERRRRYDERYGAPSDSRGSDRDRASYRGADGDFRLGVPPSGRQWQSSGPGVGSSGFGGNGPSGFGGSNVTSDPGAGRGAGATSAWGLGAGSDRDQWGHDPSYRSWRDRQVESFDRDYDEYRREHQSKFESEFATWRTGRQGQRDALARVQEHQEVVGSDGSHVGTVDKVRGDTIILTKTDQDAGGHHHAIPSSWIETVDDKVTLRRTADQAKAHWRDTERQSAFGEAGRSSDDRDADRGSTNRDADAPHNLNRSFPGTY